MLPRIFIPGPKFTEPFVYLAWFKTPAPCYIPPQGHQGWTLRLVNKPYPRRVSIFYLTNHPMAHVNTRHKTQSSTGTIICTYPVNNNTPKPVPRNTHNSVRYSTVVQ